jgi:Tfp pilus assembly protein PilP
MRKRLFFLGVMAISAQLTGATLARAQSPARPAPAASASDAYEYRPDGRRDPFLNLLHAGTDIRGPRKTDGPATFSVSDISVRGVLQTREALVAMIQGPDNRTYVVHQGDKLADGVVKNVTPQGLVVIQDITDPLSVQKQREVRKLLRSIEDTKE